MTLQQHLPILLADFIGLTLIICALAATDTHFKTSDTIRRLLILMGLITFISLLADIGVRFAEGSSGAAPRIAIYVCKSVLYVTEADIGFLWVCFIDYYLNRDHRWQDKWLPLFAVPLYFAFAMLIINLFVPCVFRVTARNIYVRGGIFFVVLNLIPVFYMTFSLFVAARYRRLHGRFRFFNMATFLVPVVIGFGFHLLGLAYDIAWTMVAVGLISVVLSLQSRMVYIDALTGLYTRAYMDRIFARSAADVQCGMMIDVNYFKSINDHYGHVAGDQALAQVGQILSRVMINEGIAVRMAGDEFVLLFHEGNADQMAVIKERITADALLASKQLNLPYQLSLSCGGGGFDAENEDQETFIKKLDAAMYADKAAFYAKHPELERRK